MKILSVSELTFQIKSLLEPAFRSLQVKGEISNFKAQSSGHLYFSLKDAGSQISAVLFKGNAASLSRMPKEGDQVIALGELSLYAPRGQYQMVVRELQFLGVGELLLKLHQLKETLEKRGWFAPERKKPLPKLPKRIGVVTSPTGAVIQDILNVLTRRFAGFQVILNPVKVQGEGAAQEIARAIDDFNRHNLVDVLIVGRGGGSIEDLWAFNEEIVADAIFRSAIPIISAVGHETDFTIADFVADLRAPTPSAAAEMAIAEKAGLLQQLASFAKHANHRLRQLISDKRSSLTAIERHPIFRTPHALLEGPMQMLDDAKADLAASIATLLKEKRWKLEAAKARLELLKPSAKLKETKQRLTLYQERLEKALQPHLKLRKESLARLSQHLLSINPKNLLKKGYALLFSENDQSLIQSLDRVQPQQTIQALLHGGKLLATVTQVEPHDSTHSLF